MLKGIRQKPGAATKVTHGIKAGRNEGIIYKDPLTEDDYIAVPIPGFMANKILGEGASKLKPVGLVNFCIKWPKTLITWEEKFGSNKTREDIQKLSVLNALDRLRLSIIMGN